jgi:hypothetical protein
MGQKAGRRQLFPSEFPLLSSRQYGAQQLCGVSHFIPHQHRIYSAIERERAEGAAMQFGVAAARTRNPGPPLTDRASSPTAASDHSTQSSRHGDLPDFRPVFARSPELRSHTLTTAPAKRSLAAARLCQRDCAPLRGEYAHRPAWRATRGCGLAAPSRAQRPWRHPQPALPLISARSRRRSPAPLSPRRPMPGFQEPLDRWSNRRAAFSPLGDGAQLTRR